LAVVIQPQRALGITEEIAIAGAPQPSYANDAQLKLDHA
jgi:hypothetical protein